MTRPAAVVASALLAAALAGCSAGGVTVPGILVITSSPAAPASEPAWGQGWIQQDPQPVQRPGAAANERLATRMAAGYGWTGRQAACLDSLWMKVSDFDPFYVNDLYNGIAGLSGHVIDPSLPARPSVRDLQSSGWFAAQPGLQIAQGLADIAVFWGTPCAEQAADASAPAGTYPPGRTFAGSLVFTLAGGRLALTPETLQSLCGLPGAPVPDPPPACTHITQATTWPAS